MSLSVRRVATRSRAEALAIPWQIVVAYAVALVPAITLAIVQPVWSRVDEPQHADVLSQYAHGAWPVEGKTMLQREIIAEDAATGVYRWYPANAGPVPGVTDPAAFQPPPSDATPTARNAWYSRHVWGYSYEAMQPPLYYLLAEPAWMLGHQLAGVPGGVYAVRIFSALIAALLAPLTYLLVKVLRPAAQTSAWLGAGMATLLPGFALNASQVTNDGLVAVLGAGLFVLAVSGARDGWTVGRAAAAGALLGATAMAKLTGAGLAPLLLLALLWPGPTPLRDRMRPVLAAVAAGAAVCLPWLAVNVRVYGQPIPSRAAHSLVGQVFGVPSPTPGYLYRSAFNAAATFWTGEPYKTLPHTRELLWLAVALSLFAAAGLALLAIRRQARRLVDLVAAGVATQFAWVLVTPWISHVGGLMPGRYAYPAAAGTLALYAVGLGALPAVLRWAATAAAATGAIASMALFCVLPAPGSHHVAPPGGLPGAQVDATAAEEGFTINADRLYVTKDGREVWVHVNLANHGRDAVEWSPMPAAWTAHNSSLGADYASSSAIPERLEPGDHWSGWIRFTRSQKGSVPILLLTFHGITADGYRTLHNLDVFLKPAGS